MTMKNKHLHRQARSAQGASLIVVLMILVIVSLLGVGGAQIALMSERGARNDRDMQMAWQAAEAALIDAELDMTTARTAEINGKSKIAFIQGCGTTGRSIGLCDTNLTRPEWLTVDFSDTSSSAPTVQFGAFTGRSFATGGIGIQPAQAPRYLIEIMQDPSDSSAYIYRVTAMGFGPRADIQAVLQMLYRV